MKKGDRVSVLDEDLKGKIISIKGNLVEIEDNFGFSYTFPQSKLVLQQDIYQEISVMKKQENTKNISKKHTKNELKLDLHFDQLVENPEKYEAWERSFIQKEKLVETLDYCRENSIKKLLIIHGLGDGILQEMVYDVLRGYPHIEFEENEFFKHSSASIEVKFYF
ncbi:MAG: DNA mismatch repair protein [Flavobacteriaceae bacterium]|nr:DNA mismatch repair protein [Flavobacteriaceae bacterium]